MIPAPGFWTALPEALLHLLTDKRESPPPP